MMFTRSVVLTCTFLVLFDRVLATDGISFNEAADIVILIDASDSIADEDFFSLKYLAANFIDNFEIGQYAIHVDIISEEQISLQPPKSKNELKLKATNLQQPKVGDEPANQQNPKFGTNTAQGIEEARNMIDQQGRPDVPAIIIVLTDGGSVNSYSTINEASMAKENDITVIAVGVGQNIFSNELSKIASDPEFVFKVADFPSPEDTVVSILLQFQLSLKI